jgi:hypothetical protein
MHVSYNMAVVLSFLQRERTVKVILKKFRTVDRVSAFPLNDKILPLSSCREENGKTIKLKRISIRCLKLFFLNRAF